MKRVAIVGAGGFVGNRTVEMLHLRGRMEVVPVARRAAGLALASRFPLQGAVADALDQKSLEEAFKSCDGVVASIAGSCSRAGWAGRAARNAASTDGAAVAEPLAAGSSAG